MKRHALAAALLLGLFVVPATAQQPTLAPRKAPVAEPTMGISPGEVNATPEMWFYQEQLRRREDPKVAVREKAEYRSAQRASRLASQKWFGFSNSRPTAGSDPYHGEYSPSWVGGNDNYKFRWYGAGRPWVVARPAVPVALY